MNTETLAEYYQFLDDLRESGVTNMYGAGAYLEEEFGMSAKEARTVLKQWMRSFSKDKTAAERAAKVSSIGKAL